MLDFQDIQKDLEKLRKSRDVLSYVTDSTAAYGALVIETSGEPVVETGMIEGEIDNLAVKIAALWRDSKEVASMLGEVSFNETIYLGGSRHIFINLCGLNHLLVVLYGLESNLGLVKMYAGIAADRVATLLAVEDNTEGATQEIEKTG